jgi:hypothetical protein
MIMILLFIITLNAINLVNANYNFLLNNQGWKIIGNKQIEDSVHQSYNINNLMSHYIIGKDKLINVDYKNKDDKNIWYFQSPLTYIDNKSSFICFTITSFEGDFNKLNNNIDYIIKIKNDKTELKYNINDYNGKDKIFYFPLLNNFNNEYVIIEILGDWTRGNEVIGIDNIYIK